MESCRVACGNDNDAGFFDVVPTDRPSISDYFALPSSVYTLQILLYYCQRLLCLSPTKEEVHVFARVCLSVCLSVCKITQNACMDLDEMLRVNSMDELINF